MSDIPDLKQRIEDGTSLDFVKSGAGVYVPKGQIKPERPNRLMRRQLEKRARRYRKYQADLAQKRK